MTQKCVLETDGYQVSFDLKETPIYAEDVEMVVELVLDQYLGSIAAQSVPTLIAVRDLYRLVEYFEAHIAQLLRHPDHESSTFVPMELGFQVQALAGEVQAENAGEFSLRFLVNVGRSEADGHRVYAGGEAVVTLTNLRRFVTSLQETLADLDRVAVRVFLI